MLASRYQIQALTGRGGMGVVYKAWDPLLDETVAIKVLRPEIARTPAMRDRFRSEIKLARKVRHRHVCAIHEYGEQDGVAYIVMEHVDGVTLRRRVRLDGPLPPRETLTLAVQLLKGLQAVHDVGIVHRDLKSANIMIDDHGAVRMMDFGMARSRTGDREGGSGIVVGTPEYMSPEQAKGERADFPSDIYSAGVIIYETITGNLPFLGKTVVAVLQQHLNEAPPLEGPAAALIPPGLRPVLKKAMAKDPAERFATVRGMATAVRAAIAESPLAITPGRPEEESAARNTDTDTREHDPSTITVLEAVPAVVPDLPVAGDGGQELHDLVEALASPDAKVRLWAALALAEVAEARAAVPALVQALMDLDPAVAEAADATLKKYAGDAGPAAQTPLPAPAPVAQSAAVISLDGLVHMLEEEKADARWRAVMALGTLGPAASDAVPALCRALEDGDVSVRWEAARTLGRVGSAAQRGVPLLIAALSDRDDAFMRQYAAEALGHIGPAPVRVRGGEGDDGTARPRFSAAAVPALIGALRDPTAAVQEAADAALVEIGLAAVPSLIEAARDDDERVRSRAASALIRIASEDQPR